LLFLKMAHEQSQLIGRLSIMPPDNDRKPLDWPSLLALDGTDLETHYRHVLAELGKKSACSSAPDFSPGLAATTKREIGNINILMSVYESIRFQTVEFLNFTPFVYSNLQQGFR
jgi:hypothetical protein